MTSVNELADRIGIVRDNIARAAERAGRSIEEISLVAVSKTTPAERVVAVAGLGVTDFGENRVQEAEEKIPQTIQLLAPEIATSLRWHLIGHLQSNKSRQAVRLFSIIESVDSVHLATTLGRLARERGTPLDILLEVNVGEEDTKFGFTVPQVPVAFREISAIEGLKVRGLMTVAPPVLDPEAVRPYFRQLRNLRDQLEATDSQIHLPVLSMGMTGDYPVAIEEGATIVRVGRAIFGDRT